MHMCDFMHDVRLSILCPSLSLSLSAVARLE
jgi:hypothetical protein